MRIRGICHEFDSQLEIGIFGGWPDVDFPSDAEMVDRIGRMITNVLDKLDEGKFGGVDEVKDCTIFVDSRSASLFHIRGLNVTGAVIARIGSRGL